MGKVHGSITRAGKVRNKTPPVNKTEKPRKLTGRARKRRLYERRLIEEQENQRRRRR